MRGGYWSYKLTDLVELVLLFLPLDWVSLTVDHCVRSDNTVWAGVGLDHLELYCAHASTHQEEIALADWSVCLQEVGLQVRVEQITGNIVSGYCEGFGLG